MTEETIENSPEATSQSNERLDRAKIIAAVAATAVAGFLGIGSKVEAATPKTGIGTAITAENSASPKAPRAVEQLPGYGEKVSKEYQDLLKDMTGKVLRRSESYLPFRRWCTYVLYGDLATTAAHCHAQETGWTYGMPMPKQKYNTPAYDILFPSSESLFEYAITDAAPGPISTPAPIEGISVYTGGTDFAVMKIGGKEDASAISSPLLTPDKMQIDSNPQAKVKLAFADAEPTLGQEVYEYTIPAANGGEKPVGQKGRYLGRISVNITDKGWVKYDIVGLKVRNNRSNPSGGGGSGGGAITAKGNILGPLAISTSNRNPKDFNSTSAQDYIIEQLLKQKGIAVEPGQFSDLAGHAVISKETLKKTIAGLGVPLKNG